MITCCIIEGLFNSMKMPVCNINACYFGRKLNVVSTLFEGVKLSND